MRYRLQTLFVITAVASIGLGVLLSWWTRPYALTGSYPSGQRAWEQWERRTLTFQIEHIETIRWYPEGRVAYRSHAPGTRSKAYYAPDGEITDDAHTWANKYGSLLRDALEDDDSRRPYRKLLWWWNGW